MICYYRNSISYSANRKEFEDQSVIKLKFDQIEIRPIRVSHFGDILESQKRRERGREKGREEEEEERYGFLWLCMDISCSISRV